MRIFGIKKRHLKNSLTVKKLDAELGHLSTFGLDMFFSCPVINRVLINFLYVWILFWNASGFLLLF